MDRKCSCVIPFYNERRRIGNVLSEIIKVKNLNEIICVDGDSTDGGYDFVRENFPNVRLVKMKRNLGKTEAVAAGVKKATGDYILLLDADLLGVDHKQIEFIIKNTVENEEIDMLILKRSHTPFGSRLVRSDLIFSGERLIKKKDLDKILTLPISKYQLEIATNKYMIDHQKKSYWLQCSTQNTPKIAKEGWLVGYFHELKMKINVMSYDFFGYFWQILFFCRQSAPFTP